MSFDLDGTLYDYDRCHCRALEATGLVAHGMLGVSQGHFTRLYRASRATVHRRLSGTAASHSRLLYFQELVRRHTGRPAPRNVRKLEATYWSAFLEHMRPFRGIPSVINQLRRASVKVAVTTDMLAAVQLRKLVRLGFGDVFDVVVTSEEAGREKPDPVIFELCVRRLGMPAERVVHVGDDYSRDVEGADGAGLQAVWFAPGAKKTSDGLVRTVGELAERLCLRP